MADIAAPAEPIPRNEVRDYVLDMIAQLATLARDNGDGRLAALLERVLVAATGSGREH